MVLLAAILRELWRCCTTRSTIAFVAVTFVLAYQTFHTTKALSLSLSAASGSRLHTAPNKRNGTLGPHDSSLLSTVTRASSTHEGTRRSGATLGEEANVPEIERVGPTELAVSRTPVPTPPFQFEINHRLYQKGLSPHSIPPGRARSCVCTTYAQSGTEA
eukprot:3710792-Rhodomonas_salina.1